MYMGRSLRRLGVAEVFLFTAASDPRRPWEPLKDVAQLHERLLKRGPVDTLILEAGVLGRPELVRDLLYYVNMGGKLVLVGDSFQRLPKNKQRPIDSLLRPRKGEVGEAFARAIGEMTVSRELVSITKDGQHFVPFREDDFSPDLVAQLGWNWVEIREVERGREFEIPGPASMNNAQMMGRARRKGLLPARRIRVYRDVLVAPGQVVLHGEAALPETYRHYRAPDFVKRSRTNSVTERFVSPRDPITPVRDMAGVYFHLDSEFVDIYGHLVTEVVSKLWAWDEMKLEYPDLKALVGSGKGGGIPKWFRDTLIAYGIPSGDIVEFSGPVRVEKLIGSTALFSNPYVAHPELVNVWAKLRQGLVEGAPATPVGDKIFVARRASLTRRCHQEQELFGLFVTHGFEIFYPEEHSLSVQARVFEKASAVAGYAGSGMLNGIYGRSGQTWIIISPDTYNAMNEYLIASVLGNPIHYFYGEADIQHEANRWTVAAFKSDFTFDLGTHGAGLPELLQSVA